MENGITDAPAMEKLTEGIANLFDQMVTAPSHEAHNAATDLREEIHDLIQKFEEKVSAGVYAKEHSDWLKSAGVHVSRLEELDMEFEVYGEI